MCLTKPIGFELFTKGAGRGIGIGLKAMVSEKGVLSLWESRVEDVSMNRKNRAAGRSRDHIDGVLKAATATDSALSEVRNSIPPDSFAALIGLVRVNDSFSAPLFHEAYPRSFAELKPSAPVLDPSSFGSEL